MLICSFCLTVLYAGCIQVQESFLEEDRIKLFIQLRKDSRLHLHTYRYVIFFMGLKLRSLPTVLCRRLVTSYI